MRKIALDGASHYIFYASMFVIFRPKPLALLPILITEIVHTAWWLSGVLAFLNARLHQALTVAAWHQQQQSRHATRFRVLCVNLLVKVLLRIDEVLGREGVHRGEEVAPRKARRRRWPRGVER